MIWFSDDVVNQAKRIDVRDDVATRDYEELEDAVVIYNRVPKTASTSFVGLVYDLCRQNKYHVLHINVTNNMHTLTLTNQVQCQLDVYENII
jgi:heparan sulfate 2-O-sulfotransferase HS2ST1